ncbi:divalent-cation tolerance protein CutA [Magnetofaba australis]|uniref:Putative periplasmic divalent cation tolerance protein n=1 Tax=Magnetofaba australis IT-1 TaxID=1434232 RepID=A0A1Y2K2L1_9PROT|nr:divalent-cation tolerance protein CutA [Magnetofaba australis]OSM01424.1 putative periplasmic divalent cation tolerance protein [Magnetofaba australis IT-1]
MVESVDDALIVWCTAPDETVAESLADALVSERLAACVHLLPMGRSIYRWQGKIERESEVTLIIKTRAARFAALQERLMALHPYDTPEILATPVAGGLPDYLHWLAQEVNPH